jgi:hypothetical protein
MTAPNTRPPQEAIDFKLLRHVQARALPFIPLAARRQIGDFVAGKISELIGAPPPPPPSHAEFEREGLLPLGRVMTPLQVSEVVDHLKGFAVFDGHMLMQSDRVPREFIDLSRTAHYAAYQRAAVVRAPHLLSIANRPEIIALAASMLGCWPTLYSLHAWWSFGGRPVPARYSQAFHRDTDDIRFCTLFIYLTDVDIERGPHQFIRRSHRLEGLSEMLERAAAVDPSVDPGDAESLMVTGYGLDDVYERLLGTNIETIIGDAGCAFMADTSGLHRGLPPRTGDRLIFWARYGLLPNWSMDEDWFEPVPRSELACPLPDDALTRYINRALIR